MKKNMDIPIVSALVGIATAIFLYTTTEALFIPPPIDQEVVPVPQGTGEPSSSATMAKDTWPNRLRIPSLGLNAPVIDVGVSARGSMAVPRSYFEVGWYRYGAEPGEVGSAVIDGHVDRGAGLDAVFADVHTLQPGDEISIVDRTGEEIFFVVEEIETYGYKDVPLQKLFNRTDARRLNLVTCTGEWLREENTYDKRVVVYAVVEENDQKQG